MTRLVVLSPHLDDAVLSLAGHIQRLRRKGTEVRIVTVFAGDPDWIGSPSSWDGKRGHDAAIETFAARRSEDLAAMAQLDVEYVWLPFTDAAYANPRDPQAIWDAASIHLHDADAVAVPGGPLTHPDHEFVTTLGHVHHGDLPLLFFAELPYSFRPSHLGGFLRRETPPSLRARAGGNLEWTTIRLTRAEHRTKQRAVACYRGELAALGWRGWLDTVTGPVLRMERIAPLPGKQLPEGLDGL